MTASNDGKKQIKSDASQVLHVNGDFVHLDADGHVIKTERARKFKAATEKMNADIAQHDKDQALRAAMQAQLDDR